MKLSNSTRIRLVTVFLSTFLTFGIGGYSAVHSRSVEISQVDRELSLVVDSVRENASQPLGAALFTVQQNSLDVALVLLTHTGDLTRVSDPSTPTFLPDLHSVKRALSHPASFIGRHSSRVFATQITGNDYLVVAKSIDGVEARFRASIRTALFFTVGINGVALLLVLIYFRRLNRSEERAALARMQEFLGDASHELRTPLTVIKGYVEMLSKGQLSAPEDQQRAFSRVGSEITRMESLIQDLLLLAELGESGKRVSERVNLSGLLSAHASDFVTLHPARKVKVVIEPEIYISATKDYISRFIQNALTNIARHTPDSAPVTISLTASAKELTLIIEDGGPGLPDGSYGKKMRSFNRFDPSRSRENGGSGLGMSIMAAVVSKLNGDLQLQKSELGGLALITTLPRTPEADI